MNKVYAGATPKEKEKLVNEYLPLVNNNARGLARRSTDPVEDLIQVGNIGLIKAVDKFNPLVGSSFKTYATYFITGHIRHYLRDRQTLVRGPRALQELSYRLRQVTQELSHRLGREATNQELAEALNVSTDLIDQARVYDRRVTVMWLDQETGDGEDDEQRSLLNTLADPTTSNAYTSERDERLVLTEAMRHLPDSQRELLKMRYFDDLTQAELSRRLGISQMEVCRRLKKAEKQLRAIVANPNIR